MMFYIYKKLSGTFKVSAPLLMLLGTVLAFQNCGKFRSSFDLSSQNLSSTPTSLPDGSTPAPTPGIAINPTQPMFPADFSVGSLTVCGNGCAFQTPSAAVASATDGSVVEIKAGDYEDCFQIHKNFVTIRGIGGYAHLHTKICSNDPKGGIVNYGTGTKLENLELSGFDTPDFSTASIRHDVLASGLTVSNCYFHDSQNPVLLTASNDTVVFQDCLFDRTGALRTDGEISVPIYEAGQNGKLVIRHSQFLNAMGGATEVKTRARETVIDCSVFANLTGSDSYSINPQLGGMLTVTNSVFEKGALSQNPNFIGFGDTPNPSYTHSIYLSGNQFINDHASSNLLHIFRGQATVKRLQNIFVGPGAGAMIDSTGTAFDLGDLAMNSTLADRPASLGPFPALPAAGPCIP